MAEAASLAPVTAIEPTTQQQCLLSSTTAKELSTAEQQLSASAPTTTTDKKLPTASGSTGVLEGLRQAHADFVAWLHQPHGTIIDAEMAKCEARGVERKFVGYSLGVLAVALLFTSIGPLLANIICIAYPIRLGYHILRGPSNESHRLVAYWTTFGLFSLSDYYLDEWTLYWILKVVAAVFLYLPQTQGALLIYKKVLEPVADVILQITDQINNKLV